jgi:hypothetical protein
VGEKVEPWTVYKVYKYGDLVEFHGDVYRAQNNNHASKPVGGADPRTWTCLSPEEPQCSDELEARCTPFLHSHSSCRAHGTDQPELYADAPVKKAEKQEVASPDMFIRVGLVVIATLALISVLMVCAFI